MKYLYAITVATYGVAILTIAGAFLHLWWKNRPTTQQWGEGRNH